MLTAIASVILTLIAGVFYIVIGGAIIYAMFLLLKNFGWTLLGVVLFFWLIYLVI